MSTPGDLSTLSDPFLARVALAAAKHSTCAELRRRLEAKMTSEGHLLSQAKQADMRTVIEWLRMNERAS
jgi:hypothetical protein